MNDTDKFCPECGTLNAGVPSAVEIPAVPVTAAEPAKKKRVSVGTILWAGFVILCLVGILVVKLDMKKNGNSKDGQLTITETVDGVEYTGKYNGALKDGEPNGNGVLKMTTDYGFATFDGKWENGAFVNGTLTRDFTGHESINKIIVEGDFADFELNGSGTRTYIYKNDYASETNISQSVLTSKFSNGIATGESELTIYYSDDYAESNGKDYTVYSGSYKNGSLIEPYDRIDYDGGTIIMKGTVKGGVFYPDDEFKSIGDKLFDEIISEYGFALDIIEYVGENVSDIL